MEYGKIYFQSEYKTCVLLHDWNHVEIYLSTKNEGYSNWFVGHLPYKSFPNRNEAMNFLENIAPVYTNPKNEKYLQVIEFSL